MARNGPSFSRNENAATQAACRPGAHAMSIFRNLRWALFWNMVGVLSEARVDAAMFVAGS